MLKLLIKHINLIPFFIIINNNNNNNHFYFTNMVDNIKQTQNTAA